ncbi:DUF6464 family protein [Capilliphycus salinus ALCB114379]|uniref:DUF6464 family protein n=1 Tax=Capilliphycus salinus TaxID=2768948 RepID=UPI0039A55134
MFISLFILILGVSPAIIYWQFRQRIETRVIGQLSTVGTGLTVTHWRRSDLPPDAQYVEGVGYLIGDLSCQYNARSSYIRCAVNPSGPCEDCRFYQAKSLSQEEN